MSVLSILQKGAFPFIIEAIILCAALLLAIRAGSIYDEHAANGLKSFISRALAGIAVVLSFFLRLNECLFGEEKFSRIDQYPSPAATLVGLMLFIAAICIFECTNKKRSSTAVSKKRIIIESAISEVIVIAVALIVSNYT